MAFTLEILPLIWSIITQKGTSLAFKDLVITLVLGYISCTLCIFYIKQSFINLLKVKNQFKLYRYQYVERMDLTVFNKKLLN